MHTATQRERKLRPPPCRAATVAGFALSPCLCWCRSPCCPRCRYGSPGLGRWPWPRRFGAAAECPAWPLSRRAPMLEWVSFPLANWWWCSGGCRFFGKSQPASISGYVARWRSHWGSLWGASIYGGAKLPCSLALFPCIVFFYRILSQSLRTMTIMLSQDSINRRSQWGCKRPHWTTLISLAVAVYMAPRGVKREPIALYKLPLPAATSSASESRS